MPAHYSLPVFNNVVNIWRNGRLYTDPPDVITVGNLALGRRVGGSKLQSNTTNPSDGGMWLLVPIATDVRDSKALSGEDMVEVPAGTGRLYTVKWVDDIGKGFANEHRFAVIFGLPPWGVPFPGPPSPPPGPPVTLPYAFVGPAPATGDSITFVPTGNLVLATVWMFSPSGTFPLLNTSSAGSLFPIDNTTIINSANGVKGIVYMFLWTPSLPHETVSVATNDPLAAFAWEVDDLGGYAQDDTMPGTFVGVTSGTISLFSNGPTNDNNFVAIIIGPGFGVPTITPVSWNQVVELPAFNVADTFGDVWGLSMYFWGSTPAPGSNSFTITYFSNSDFSAVGLSVKF